MVVTLAVVAVAVVGSIIGVVPPRTRRARPRPFRAARGRRRRPVVDHRGPPRSPQPPGDQGPDLRAAPHRPRAGRGRRGRRRGDAADGPTRRGRPLGQSLAARPGRPGQAHRGACAPPAARRDRRPRGRRGGAGPDRARRTARRSTQPLTIFLDDDQAEPSATSRSCPRTCLRCRPTRRTPRWGESPARAS